MRQCNTNVWMRLVIHPINTLIECINSVLELRG